MKIVYATTNPGKFGEVEKIFSRHNLSIINPTSLGIEVDVEETGQTLEENSRLKAETYLKLLPADTVVIGDDTGIEIDALGGEPGIKVRRWLGHKMTDEEIINYCLRRLRGVPKGQRGAQFRTVLAIAVSGKETKFYDGTARGEILTESLPHRHEGMPFWPLFYFPNLKMSLGEFHAQPMEFQLQHPTHRERAVLAALPYLKQIL